MARIGLEISDVGILAGLEHADELLNVDHDRAESPGVALQTKGTLLVGWDALHQARLHPRQSTNRFWSMLSTDPLQERALSAQNYAELAVAHLQAVTQALPVAEPVWLLAVPDFMDQSKLGVLLGVTRALGLNVEGIAANAVASVQPGKPDAAIVHIDVHLHRVELASLRQSDRLRRMAVHPVSDAGWDRLVDDVARRMADEFVQATRFDPLHEAAAEQSLYDQVQAALSQPLRGQPLPLELRLGRSSYRISISTQVVAEAARPLREKVLRALHALRAETVGEEGRLHVQLSHRAARIPGLPEAIASISGIDARLLPRGAGVWGVLNMAADLAEESGQGGVMFLSSKAVQPAGEPPPLPADGPLVRPTHVLVDFVAYPLGGTPLRILRAGETWTIEPGDPAEDDAAVCRIHSGGGDVEVESVGAGRLRFDDARGGDRGRVATGDRVWVEPGGVELLFIQVRPGAETT